MVWGMKDRLFRLQLAQWLDRTLPNSRGIQRIEDAKLFFADEIWTSLLRKPSNYGTCEHRRSCCCARSRFGVVLPMQAL
jgi:hypothetical protein